MFSLKWVPLPIVEAAIKEKNHREIELFIGLKMLTSSRFKLSSSITSSLSAFCDISLNTFYRRLGQLRNWDWIGYDPTYEVYYLRSFKRIYEIEDYVSRSAVYININDLQFFQTFCFSACVANLLRNHKRRGAERKKWRSHQPPVLYYNPVALSVMQTLFNLSKSTVTRLKKESIQLGYLERKRNLEPLHHVKDHSSYFYMSHPELWGLLRRDGCMVSVMRPDLFVDNHRFKTLKWR